MARTEHHDQPTDADLLGFGPLAKRIAVRVLEVPPPYVLGLHGEWGSGKSTMLRLVEHEVKRHKVGIGDAMVVHFQAWRHQHEAQPAVALLHTIRASFLTETKIINALQKGTKSTIIGALRVFDEVVFSLLSGRAGGKGFINAVREEQGRQDTVEFSPLLTSEALPEALKVAIETLLGSRSRLVVLIDDLDRCTDTSVVRLLEGIKVYLSVEHTVFVIAADRDAIVEAVYRELYKGDLSKPDDDGQRRLRGRASAYVEKFFQAVDTVPAWPRTARLIQTLWRGPERDALTRLIDEHGFLPPNPRKVKRYLAELGARLDTIGPEDAGDRLPLACAVQVVQSFHPRVYREIERSPQHFRQLCNYVKTRQIGSVGGTPLAALRFLGEPNTDTDTTITRDLFDPDLFHAESLFKSLETFTDADFDGVMCRETT